MGEIIANHTVGLSHSSSVQNTMMMMMMGKPANSSRSVAYVIFSISLTLSPYLTLYIGRGKMTGDERMEDARAEDCMWRSITKHVFRNENASSHVFDE